ncbi:MAG: hypothetical protein LBQ98_08170 [Nitrososphaerota archaeon]|jgi:hypothetical protein|nr:hypothetical protein [Nitrososphaerota archaeon]
MDFKLKLVAVAVLALLAGTAFAAPMLMVDIQSLPRIIEGPKAYFEIDVVYAEFSVIEQNPSELLVGYTIITNITNCSDRDGHLYETGFVAAQHIEQRDSALGGMYINRNLNDYPPYNRASSRGGVVEGLYLAGDWIGETWIPGTDYPSNLITILNADHTVLSDVSPLPPDATDTGMWIEGVPIAEYYDGSGLFATHIYLNGSWVDVTEQIRYRTPQPFFLAYNTLSNLILTPSVSVYGANTITTAPIMGWQLGGATYTYIGGRGFDRTWLPYQSRLVRINGTESMSRDDFNTRLAGVLEYGVVDIYGFVTSYITTEPINGTLTNTAHTATVIKTLTLQQTSKGYLYDAALLTGQYFQVCPDGVDVYIKQAGE